MSSIHEILSEQFRRWEIRGRGWRVYDEPVSPEPPFEPYPTYASLVTSPVDDGRRPTLFSSFVRNLSDRLSTQQATPPVIAEAEEEPQPQSLVREKLIEVRTSLPANLNIPKDAFEQFLLNLSLCREPIAFELVGLPQRIAVQFATSGGDAPLVKRQLQAYFPEAVFETVEGTLEAAWEGSAGDDALAVEFGLEREFMFPLASGKLDPFIGIVGAMAELQPGELALFQVLFQPVQHPWPESILQSVTHADGKPFFVNAPELTNAARIKIARPLYAAVVRILVRSERQERTLQIARDLAASLRVFAHPNGNALIPLTNGEYPFDDHIEDVLRRQSRRSGMVLNTDELIGFVHLPTAAVRSPKLTRETTRTKPAPKSIQQTAGLLLGENIHAGQTVEVRLTTDQRTRHTHIVGASGTGKSTLLFNLISQDIQNGEGIAVLDPHGDLIDRILGSIPDERIEDIVLVDPSDENYSIGFNILSAHSDLEKNLLASDLVSVFQRLSTSWGDQMGSVLNNGILAFLESSQGGTLADLRRFLIEPAFRADFLKTVEDPELVYYWQKGFPQLSGNKSIGPILTRLETFLSPKPIRYMVSQRENKLDFANIMDTGKIFLAKLSQGLLGKENSYLLGSLLISKFQQLAMSRQAQETTKRRPFFVYADEFQNFITPSMAEILTGARKYRVGLVLAHQELRQLEREREVASAVSSCFTRVVFRVGDEDARKLSDGFASFEARDLQNLETGQAICRVERSDYDFNLRIPYAQEPDEAQAAKRKDKVVTASRKKYAKARADIQMAPKPVEVTIAKVVPERAPRLGVPPIKPQVPEAPKAVVVPNEETKTPGFPRDLGRGGAQHQAIQKRIKEAAEKVGFRSTIEKPILEGLGSVDLLLERNGEAIACEISISTTIDQEVGNVAKCFKAAFESVAVICVDETRLKKIAQAVAGSLGGETARQIAYYHPDRFIAFLQTLPPPVPKTPDAPETRLGYKIKRSTPKLTVEEQRLKEDVAIRSIAAEMRRRV